MLEVLDDGDGRNGDGLRSRGEGGERRFRGVLNVRCVSTFTRERVHSAHGVLSSIEDVLVGVGVPRGAGIALSMP